MMQFNFGGILLNKYVIITSLLVVFGFLFYIIQYEDIGSDIHIQPSNYGFNFELAKHTFNVKEYHNNNGDISVVGYYDENEKYGKKVILSLKNFPLNQEIINSETEQVLDPKRIQTTETKTFEMSSAKANHKISRVQNIQENLISTKMTSATSTTVIANALKVNKDKTEKFPDAKLFRKNRINKVINCAKLISGDEEEQDKAKHIMEKPKPNISPKVFINLTKHCDLFKLKKGYITSSLTEEEENFPIAYSLLVFKDIDQVERLLRAIYRPQNVYCIHVDKKSKKLFTDAVKNIASCFQNVFVTSKSVDVQWGTFSVLEPELICLEELWKYKKWKYFINLTGQEFPLRTNLELVKILKIYNGSNDMEGTVKRANKWRFEKAGPVPHGIVPTKGSIHITANRDFIDYVLHNQIAKDFLNWTRKVDVPDETFFTSLNHNPQLKIPGSYTGEPETDNDKKPFLTRFKNWGISPFNWDCKGQRVRLICIFGIGDLPLLSTRPEFFANKFYNFYEPLALDCMEELHYNRTREEYFQTRIFNTTFYENLEFIKKKI